MKWFNLVQMIMLFYVIVLLINFKTITQAGEMVFEIFILLSFAISVIMFIVSVKRSKKLKTEKQISKGNKWQTLKLNFMKKATMFYWF